MQQTLVSAYGVLVGTPDIFRGANERLYVAGFWQDGSFKGFGTLAADEVTVVVS